MDFSTVGFVTGLRAEARIARRLSPRVAAGGGTYEGAVRAAERLIAEGATALVSFGLAGGLHPGLRPGALVVPAFVRLDGRDYATDRALSGALAPGEGLAGGTLTRGASHRDLSRTAGEVNGAAGEPAWADHLSREAGEVGAPAPGEGLAGDTLTRGAARRDLSRKAGEVKGVAREMLMTDHLSRKAGELEGAAREPAMADHLSRKAGEVGAPAPGEGLGGGTLTRTAGEVSLLAARDALATAAAKRRAFAETGCLAVDLESGAVAEMASAHHLPFAVLRALCDPAEMDLPPLALTALSPQGGMRLDAVIAGLLASPRQLPPLLRLARHAAAARRALTGCADRARRASRHPPG